ncbi:unnamed protein product [Pedinophyceae sp. YPF-701]|nr:unnamed protein product [Pedinophyceae sp. YPF-701]
MAAVADRTRSKVTQLEQAFNDWQHGDAVYTQPFRGSKPPTVGDKDAAHWMDIEVVTHCLNQMSMEDRAHVTLDHFRKIKEALCDDGNFRDLSKERNRPADGIERKTAQIVMTADEAGPKGVELEGHQLSKVKRQVQWLYKHCKTFPWKLNEMLADKLENIRDQWGLSVLNRSNLEGSHKPPQTKPSAEDQTGTPQTYTPASSSHTVRNDLSRKQQALEQRFDEAASSLVSHARQPAERKDESQCPKRPHQVKALQWLSSPRAKAGPAILQLPCGSGKTLVMGWAMQEVTRGGKWAVVVVNPLRKIAKQNLERLSDFARDALHVPAWSGSGQAGWHKNITKKEDIERCMRNDAKVVLLSCCASKTLVNIAQALVDNEDGLNGRRMLVMVDEAHHMNSQYKDAASTSQQGHAPWKLVRAATRAFLVTGTPPRALEEEFGKPGYSMKLSEAIAQGFVADYRMWTPRGSGGATEKPKQKKGSKKSTHAASSSGGRAKAFPGLTDRNKRAFLDDSRVSDVEAFFRAAALFCAAGMRKQGCRCCIAFCSAKEECDFLNEAFEAACGLLGARAHVAKIISDSKEEEREKAIAEFQENSKQSGTLSLLSSIRILDEAVDIPQCDSVLFTSLAKNITECGAARAMQRLCRAVRGGKGKVAHAFVWADPDGGDEASKSWEGFIGALQEGDAGVARKVGSFAV